MNTYQFVAEIEKLPLNIQKEVMDFIEFLVAKYSLKSKPKTKKSKKGKYKFDWAGGLSHLKDKYTSVELQHHINTLR